MSAQDWLQAAKTEEERLIDEIAKTALYKQLEAVRAVFAVYEETADAVKTPEQQPPTLAPTPTKGQASRSSFKTANAFSGLVQAAADGSSRSSPQ